VAPRVLTVALAAIGVGFGVLAPSVARADAPPTVRLDYRADPASGCPDGDALAAGVTGRLGRDPFAAGAPRALEVDVRSTPAGREARIVVRRGDAIEGERRLASDRPTCTELAEELEFAIALAIDPAAGAAIVPSAPVAPPPAPTRVVVVAAAPAPARAPPHRTALEVGVLVAEGTSPGRTAGVAGGIRRELGRWSLGTELRLDRSGERTLPGGARVGGGLVALSGVGCRRLVPWLELCALASAGRIASHGEGVTDGNEVTSPLFGVGGRAAVGGPIGPLFLSLHADALLASTRAVLVVADEVAWTSARAPLALGVRVGAPL
jgi:hypothetical protein